MDNLTAYIIYLTIFRLAIIVAGITSVVLGYRLFVRGVFPETNITSAEGQNVVAKIAGAEFTLRNAAPGTCFAFFGAITISIMFLTGGPEMTLDVSEKGDTKVVLRGEEDTQPIAPAKRALKHLEDGNRDNARQTVQRALQQLAPHLNDYAWVYLKTNRESTQTIWLAKLAVDVEPQNPYYLHTLAEIQYYNGEEIEAVKTLARAQAIDPAFTEQLEKWRSQVEDR